ncbi:alpha-tocopherol transfer protein-like [Macrosteles quadrilineatus]|uniref:alpha-tocopherol transfer protein-like n=1 Tax=Macrosteles quadrilineatus TaxID=74068 RepID=UPI0023E0FC42|nr:alpha-tocopherol transfer protein-like [Macrosteles quadrilineatus]
MKTKQPFLKKNVEIPKGKEMDVQNIKNWLVHQPHLPKLTDAHIVMFLHSCYYSGERTKETIDNYYTVRAQCLDLFGGRDWPRLEKLWKSLYLMAPLPKSTPEGYRILVYRLADTDPSKFNFQEALTAFFAYNDVRISEDGLVEGYIVVFDMKGATIGHLARVSTCMHLVRKFMVYIQDCHPVRLKGVHVINTVSFIDSCLGLVKPFIQSGLMQLIHLHSDLKTLEKFFPLELLPSDYGGMAPDTVTLADEHMKLVAKNYKDWLKDSEKSIADLKRRIGKPKNQIMELEGSFKTLEID